MDYRFSAANEALRQAGQLVQATTADGKLLPILRNALTGKIAEIAKATVGFSLRSIRSIVAPAQLVMGPIQMVQNHLGFQETYKKMDGLAHQN
ncbi:MAG: hypothetical protein J7641_02925 [Cyanobacteria bacterium SID2]|nr:hypothetical protein [Cyanobacteria bacterium SID2]